MTQSELQERLLDARAYPRPPGTIEFHETHASLLFLTDQRVYKIKRAVNLGFLDFSTLELRHHFCMEEINLNRRFAPQTYLGVVPIRCHNGEIQIDGKSGEIIEYAVLMRRLPEDRMLHKLIERHDPGLPDEAIRLGTTLARMHASCQICRDEDEECVTIVRRNWEENFSQMEPYANVTITSTALALCREQIKKSIDTLSPVIRERDAAGLIRDGHGDLHADHICLTEPICIYDCIEFNRRFRVGDILADLAFLLMDLDKRGEQDLARIIEKTWCTTLNESIHPELLRFFKIYRAFVRGKVNSFLSNDLTLSAEERAAATKEGQEYFNLALGYLAPQSLIITCGAMGVGKSTLSSKLAAALCAPRLRSDLLRKELFASTPQQQPPDLFAQGLYSPARSRQTYDALLEQTAAGLAAGKTVIVDAAFADPAERQRFRQLSSNARVPFTLLHLHCNEEIAVERLNQRQREGLDPSDGRADLLAQHLRTFQMPGPAEGAIIIDTSLDLHDNIQKILTALITKAHTTV